jgi:hypothetical protein
MNYSENILSCVLRSYEAMASRKAELKLNLKSYNSLRKHTLPCTENYGDSFIKNVLLTL